MGLDMYLHRKTYVKNWDYMKPEHRHQVSVKLNNKKHPYINTKMISTIEEEVGYWRKANQIHSWFVNNVQDGMDDCKEYYVDVNQLKELYDICKKIHESKVLSDNNIDPGDILPTESGFFFGPTEYDEWYYQNIEDTIKIIEPILLLDYELNEKRNNGEIVTDWPEYYYGSSW